MATRRRRRVAGASALLALAAAAAWYWLVPLRVPPGFRACTRVIDGDTIVLDGGERVRLIGVQAPERNDPRPEVRRMAEQAGEFTRRLCEGRAVRLEYDFQPQDRYGRTLAYIYLEDGTLVNAELIRQGYANAYTRFPFRYLEDFRAHQQEARAAGRGLWRAAP